MVPINPPIKGVKIWGTGSQEKRCKPHGLHLHHGTITNLKQYVTKY